MIDEDRSHFPLEADQPSRGDVHNEHAVLRAIAIPGRDIQGIMGTPTGPLASPPAAR